MMPVEFETVQLGSADDFVVPEIPTGYELALDTFKLDFYVHPKKDARRLFIFSPGFMDRKSFTLPFFQRIRWFEAIDAAGIVLSDPTLNLDSNLGISWFQGSAEDHFIPKVAAALESLIDKFGMSMDNVTFFGSSAGGFVSLMLAGHLGGRAVVNNPQTDILKFLVGPVNYLLKTRFGGVDWETARALYDTRFRCAAFYQQIGRVPRIVYVQNAADVDHYENHMMPFLRDIRSVVGSEAVAFHVYNDPLQRHNPMVMRNIKPYLDMG